MEPSTSDEPADQTRDGWSGEDGVADVSVAVADLPPSMSAAHWANRDNDTLYRRPGRAAPFRRPPAENSFPESEQAGDTGNQQAAPRFAESTGTGLGSTGSGSTGTGFDAGVTVADPGGFDSAGFAPTESADARRADAGSRHWTTIGDEARRPRTSDRDEVNSPISAEEQAPALNPGATRSWAARRAGGVPPELSVAGAAAVPVGRSRPPGKVGRLGGRGQRKGTGQPGQPLQPGQAGQPGRPAKPAKAPRTDNADLIDTGGLLGGPSRDIRAHRAAGRPTTGSTTQSTTPRRSRAVLWATVTLSLVILLGGGVTAVAFFSGTPDQLAAVLRSDAGDTTDKSATAPVQGRTEGIFELITGTTRVTLRSADLGNDLYRITSAADSGTVPRPVVDGNRVQLHLTPDGAGASGNVEIVLAAQVRWSLRFTGGADEQRIDMSDGQLGGIDLVGGSRRVELTLPQASGTVGVRIAGAVDEFVVTAPADSPVRVQLGSGAKTVAAGNRTLRDVKPGSTLTPKDWKVADRYDIDAAARVTLLSVITAP